MDVEKMLKEAKYKKFKIGDLFEIKPTKAYKLRNDDLFKQNGKYPVVTNSSTNNGISGYSDLEPTEKGNMITYSDTTTADSIFYQPNDFIGYSHIQGLYPLKDADKWKMESLLYIVACMKKSSHKKFDYGNKFNREKAKELYIKLPITETDEIDYNLMETVIVELKAQHMQELKAHLRAANLSTYQLTEEESNAIKEFSSLKWKEFKIGDLFEKINLTKIKKQAKDLPTYKDKDHTIPALCAGVLNQGLARYVNKNDCEVIKRKISISGDGANTGVTYYQPYDFTVLQSSYAIDIKDNVNLTDNQYLFITAAISKSIYGKFHYGLKAGWERVKEEHMKLPVTETDEIDYDYMETFITATQKLVIKDLLKSFEEEENKTEKIIEKGE